MTEEIDPATLPLVVWETTKESGYQNQIRAVYTKRERVLFEICEEDALGTIRWMRYDGIPSGFLEEAAVLMSKEKSQKA